ncbi:polyphenol oxidase family protein [Acanthopleuribacter pedis]|uniref:Polyphenol oxidase family protein n=1 Tax=Acanthopleuribacter pedis TaxID=442870 RepID=A0A8J7QNM0_9BACT|nr:polyphenol oxidase family protein [Acanthopleuribacter pedis]
MIQAIHSAIFERHRGAVSFGYTLDLSGLHQRHGTVRQVTQVHGALVLDDPHYTSNQNPADGLVTDLADTALVVKTADCLPVLASDGTRLVALHAGWRGLKAGIIKSLADWLDPRSAFVFIGPAISPSCYEVDADLYQSWLRDDPALANQLSPAPAGGTKRLLDTKAVALRHLQEIGFAPEAVECSPTCTFRSGLPSWRREQPDKRRLYSFIVRRN